MRDNLVTQSCNLVNEARQQSDALMRQYEANMYSGVWMNGVPPPPPKVPIAGKLQDVIGLLNQNIIAFANYRRTAASIAGNFPDLLQRIDSLFDEYVKLRGIYANMLVSDQAADAAAKGIVSQTDTQIASIVQEVMQNRRDMMDRYIEQRNELSKSLGGPPFNTPKKT